MESSIAEFLLWLCACELQPTTLDAIRQVSCRHLPAGTCVLPAATCHQVLLSTSCIQPAVGLVPFCCQRYVLPSLLPEMCHCIL